MKPSCVPAVATAAVALTAIACSEPLEFAEWALPVPEGTPVVEYRAATDEERDTLIPTERDLVLTEALGTPLYRPSGVKVADDGRIVVLDSGNNRIVVFSPEGDSTVAFGRPGQGPGEFQSPINLGLVGDEAVVWDQRNVRFTRYRLDGTHVADHALEERIYPRDYVGHEGGMLMTAPDPAFVLLPGMEAPPMFWRAGLYSLTGERQSLILEFPRGPGPQWSRDRSAGSVPIRAPYPVAALGDGIVYVSTGVEYQVLAVEPTGAVRWALRTNDEAPLVGEDHKREIVSRLSENVEGLTYEHFTWPERYAAIEALRIDGAGNLFVFPHVARTLETFRQADGPVPVDVYAADGERVFVGAIGVDGWDAAHGDHLYRIETDPDTDEQVVARYRIVEPVGR